MVGESARRQGATAAPQSTRPHSRVQLAWPAVADAPPLGLDEPYEPRPPLDGDTHVDVCIVGGGVGGLSAAWHLTGLGVRATLLEGRTVGSGASGRNGGFLLTGGAPFHND